MDKNSALMAVKLRIVATTNTPGWYDIRKLAAQSVEKLERAALDCEDDEQANNLRREARAAKKFADDFFSRIDAERLVTEEPTDETWLEICM